MTRGPRVVLEGVLPFIVAGILFGLLYNTLFYERNLVEYVESAVIGVLLGTAAGIAEQQALRRWFQRRSFARGILLRTVAYAILVALTLSMVLSVEPALVGECGYLECVAEFVRGPLFVRDLVFTTIFVFLATFLAELSLLVGTRNIGRLLTGRYRSPREVEAEFMFVDLRGSTGIAEELGHMRYSSFLRDFFIDVSGAIHAARGEVFQYVGDEVVVVWPGARAGGRWIDCFSAMRASIAGERAKYEAGYGVVPQFKAGVHAGVVVVTEIGTLQRAIAYHGDVLNTTARVRAKCDEAGFDLLATKAAVSAVPPDRQTGFEPIGPLHLRGRTEPVEVFAFSEARVRADA